MDFEVKFGTQNVFHLVQFFKFYFGVSHCPEITLSIIEKHSPFKEIVFIKNDATKRLNHHNMTFDVIATAGHSLNSMTRAQLPSLFEPRPSPIYNSED